MERSKKYLIFPFLLYFALFLSPISQAHICHFFEKGEHHGSCGPHMKDRGASVKQPHDKDCFTFAKETVHFLVLDSRNFKGEVKTFKALYQQGDSQIQQKGQVPYPDPVPYHTTDPPDVSSDPIRGPPPFCLFSL